MNKVIVITGAAGGIGTAIAKKFIGSLLDDQVFADEDKDQIFLIDHPKKIEALEGTKSILENSCSFVNTAGIDITRSFTDWLHIPLMLYKRIDILINAAGILPPPSPVVKTDMETIRKVIEVNLLGTLNCCKAVLPIMRAQRYGRIVNISSVAGQRGDPGNAIYAASKAAVESLTKSLALEAIYCKDGETPPDITVNAVAPGIVDTPMTANLPDKALVKCLERTAIKRKIKPEEVAEAVYFLATASQAINGVILPVDGGYLAT